GAAVLDRLRVGVGGDELDAVDAAADHVRHGIAAAATHADHLDDRVRGHFFNQLEMCHDFVLFYRGFLVMCCFDEREWGMGNEGNGWVLAAHCFVPYRGFH